MENSKKWALLSYDSLISNSIYQEHQIYEDGLILISLKTSKKIATLVSNLPEILQDLKDIRSALLDTKEYTEKSVFIKFQIDPLIKKLEL